MKKTIFIFLIIGGIFTAKAQDNPYDIFGYDSKVIYEKTVNDDWLILNPDTSSPVYAMVFNFELGRISLLDKNDRIVEQIKMVSNQLYRWLSTDPLAAEYPDLSPYVFVANNAINAVDPDGRKIIFVNGYYNTGDGMMPRFISENAIGTVGLEGYWGRNFVAGARLYFKDYARPGFVDGRGAWNSTGEERYKAGYAYAKANLTTLTAGMVEGETMKIVSHSMGSAYAEGMIQYLQEQNILVEQVVHLSAADPSGFSTNNLNILQLNLENDIVLGYKNFGENNIIKGVTRFGGVKTEGGFLDDVQNSHADTKFSPHVWNMVRDLGNIQMNYTGSTSQTINVGDPGFGPSLRQTGQWGNYNATGNSFGTQFNSLKMNNSNYSGGNDKDQYTGPMGN